MAEAPADLEFGVPWAAAGEERAARRHTVLAWTNGADGGALFVERGPSRERVWIMMREWVDWVKSTRAAPVAPWPVVLFEDDPAAIDPDA